MLLRKKNFLKHDSLFKITDHIIDQEEGLVIPDDQRKAIRLEVAEALRQMGIVEALRKQGYDIVPLDPDNIEL